MKICKKAAAILLLTTSFASNASVRTDRTFDRLIENSTIESAEDQAYCYTNSKGMLEGKNLDKEIRLASVTKLITSLWAVKELGAKYTYDTKLYIKGSHLHIKGSLDPFMSNEKMIYLISSLNKLGITKLEKITFDNNVQINPGAQVHTDVYPVITKESNAKWIKLYFNTANWTKTLKADYAKYSNNAPSGRYVKNVSFSVDTVEYAEKNPLEPSVLNLPKDVRILILKSPALHKYLKEINVKSNNYASHTIFKNLGGDSVFRTYAYDIFGIRPEEMAIYNGSGLPTRIAGSRVDNVASCRIMTRLIEDLKESIERQGMGLEDVVAVPGSDGGTFRSRLNSSDLKNTLVAKTGTLMHTSSLAGALNTRKGYSFFGVFNHTQQIRNAKYIQNEMVRAILADLGGPKNFKYRVEPFLPYDKNAVVKSFDLGDSIMSIDSEDLMTSDHLDTTHSSDEETGFSEIESELIEE
jgi:D-alanyl-D-alanine carboxypeptidase/D-alanyl-D-alanine-endopeptidase (penicillin-binding protein 4)